MKPTQLLLVAIVVIASIVGVYSLLNMRTIPLISGSDEPDGNPVMTEDGELDYYLSNPFDLKAEGEKPIAKIDETEFNFDKMLLGDVRNHDFVIRNEGSVPLKLAKGRSQCKCTVSGLGTDEIPPGEEAKINLEWEPKSVGPFRQGAVIWTNDPENNQITIHVEGDMVQEVVQEPEGNWVLGSISKDTPAEIAGAIYSKIIEDFEITEITSSSEMVNASFRLMTEDEMESVEAVRGYIIEGTVSSDGRSGILKETVTVKTNLEKQPEFTYTISAAKSGPLQVIGPGWYAAGQILDMGTVNAEEGKTQKLIWMIEPGEVPLEFKVLSATPAFLEASLEAAKNSEGAKRERYTLTVKVPKDAPKGSWPREEPGSFEFETNHPLIGTFTIDVTLKIQ